MATARLTDAAYRPDALVAEDIDAYLDAHAHKSMLRFITCGSVDDGKSTLIGRLLHDSRAIFADQLAALEADSRRVGTFCCVTTPKLRVLVRSSVGLEKSGWLKTLKKSREKRAATCSLRCVVLPSERSKFHIEKPRKGFDLPERPS